MGKRKQLEVGIVGACGRGASFKSACDATGHANVRAVCDTNAAGLHEAAIRLGASEEYTDYEDMLERSRLDAVILGTPMPLHVPQAIAALKDTALTVSGYTQAGLVFYDETVLLPQEEIHGIKVHEVVAMFRAYVEE